MKATWNCLVSAWLNNIQILMSIELVILLLNTSSTWFMVGLIWFVQMVHYPLMNSVGSENYRDYQDRHQRQTTWVVGGPMLIEALTSVLLIWFSPVTNTALILMGIALLFIIWVSTALLQVPCHNQLAKNGFDNKIIRQLVLTNWIRTVCWTIRGALACWFIVEFLHHAEII